MIKMKLRKQATECLGDQDMNFELCGWKDCSMVKITCSSCRELGVSPQHPHSSLQLSVTLVSGNPTPFLPSVGTRHACIALTYIYP